ncbi:VanW family protein [Bacillus tianshenii]|nr:VanW family protein [Bacillus tianshenii]
MKFALIAFFYLLGSQMDVTDNLTVKNEGEPVASINRAELHMPIFGETVINEQGYQQFVKELKEKIHLKPVNAKIDDNGKIKEGKTGYMLNEYKFRAQFYAYYYSSGSAEMEIPKHTLHPEVDSELLANIRTKQIGSYVTYFNPTNKERSRNIKLAAEAINSHVVFPGKTFSFNQVVGKRTKEKGYMSAPVIVKGELAEGIGGGICQVSSTLFNAVDQAGVQIVKRFSHSRRVPYVPPGRDATVSWYGPDFAFKNNYNQPVLIRAKVQGGRMIITIYSSENINYESRNVPKAPAHLPVEVEAHS